VDGTYGKSQKDSTTDVRQDGRRKAKEQGVLILMHFPSSHSPGCKDFDDFVWHTNCFWTIVQHKENVMKRIALILSLIMSGCYTQLQLSNDDVPSPCPEYRPIVILPPPPPPIIIVESAAVPAQPAEQIKTVRDFGSTRGDDGQRRSGERSGSQRR
jgi:hypothetical protein